VTSQENYRSYDYLVAGEDYRAFELAEMHAGFEPYQVPLSPEDEERLDDVLAEDTVVSLH